MTESVEKAKVAEAVEEVKERFRDQLKPLRYDLGGSLADMVEEALGAAIKSVCDKKGI